MTTGPDQNVEARQRLAVAAGAALLAAGLILVMFVLPAEYGVDPLGTGARVGLLDLGVVGQQVEALSQSTANGTGQATIVVAQRYPDEPVPATGARVLKAPVNRSVDPTPHADSEPAE